MHPQLANNTKLCCVVDMLEGRDAIQRDLDRLERWACVNLMRFNKAKCKVHHMGQGNPKHKYKLGREWIDSNPDEKDLRMPVDEKLSMTWLYALAAQKADCILGCIQSSMASRSKRGFCPSALLWCNPNPKFCFQLWSPPQRTDMDLLERVQRRPQK